MMEIRANCEQPLAALGEPRHWPSRPGRGNNLHYWTRLRAP